MLEQNSKNGGLNLEDSQNQATQGNAQSEVINWQMSVEEFENNGCLVNKN